MSNRQAFEQGYVRAMYKVMDAAHAAFRNQWEPAEIEAMLRRMGEAREVEAEGKSFEEWFTGSKPGQGQG